LKSSLLEKAIDFLHTMIALGIKPDDVLLNSLLDGCEKMNKFTQAKDIFLFVRKFGVEPSMMSFSIMMKVINSLIVYNL
jgi:pentatricopeptide repeat protein